MTVTAAIDPTPAATDNAGTAATSTPPAAQAPASTPAAPETPVAPKEEGTVDWKARHDKLVNESIPKLQSDRATFENKLKEITTERDELKQKLEDLGDVDELEYEVAHERDQSYLAFLEEVANKGFTLRQVVDKLRADMRTATSQRQEIETKRSSVESVITLVERYDKDFASFLREIDKSGARVAHETLDDLRGTYERLTARGRSPEQAAAAVTAGAGDGAASSEPPTKEPPVVAPAGSASRIAGTPVWKPGARSTGLFRKALEGTLGTDFGRRERRE